MMNKVSRPLVLGGITVKVLTGCGNMYIQLNWYQGQLFEVFATLGRGGGCAACEMESLTRSITLGLKSGVPADAFVRQLRGIRCPTPMPFPKESAVLSCPDAIAVTLAKYGVLGIGAIISLLKSINGHMDDSVSTVVVEGVELSPKEIEGRVQDLALEREEQGVYG